MLPKVTALLDAMDKSLGRIDAAANPPLAGKLRIADLMARWLRHGERSGYHARFYDEGLSLLRRLDALTGQGRSIDSLIAPIDPTERPECFEARVRSLFRQLIDGQNRLAQVPQGGDAGALRADLAAWEYGYYADRSSPPRSTGDGNRPVAQTPRHPGQDAVHAAACARSAAAAGAAVRDAAPALVRLRRTPIDGADALVNAIIEQLQIVYLAPLDPADEPASAAAGTSGWLGAWRDYWHTLDMASPSVSRALHLLEATLPGGDAAAGRVHGGCNADRILVAADGSVVLDGWGMNHWGDPIEDLADLTVALEDRLPAGAVVRAYEQRIGAAIPAFRLAWFVLFARVKQAISSYGALAALEPDGVPDAAALAAAVRQLPPAMTSLQTLACAMIPSAR